MLHMVSISKRRWELMSRNVELICTEFLSRLLVILSISGGHDRINVESSEHPKVRVISAVP